MDLDKEITAALEQYGIKARNMVMEAAQVAAKRTAKRLQTGAETPRRSGDYGRSWRVKKTDRGFTVHNKDHYRLAHLLEKSHKTPKGKTEPRPHIAPAEAEGAEIFVEEVKKRL